METQDSRGAGGEPYNSRSHVPTGPNTHIHNHTPVDGYGKHTPKIICFMKVCNGHTQGIFLTFKPEKLQYLWINLFDCTSGNMLRGSIDEKENCCL